MNVHRAAVALTALGVLVACSRDDSLPQAGAAGAADAGAGLYAANCTPCHQRDGHGIPGVYPSLAGSAVVLGDPAALARWVVKGQRPPSLPAGRYPTAMMPFGWLKPPAAAALFTYLRSSFGNTAPPVAAATVARALDAPP